MHKVTLTPATEYKKYADGFEAWNGDELLIILRYGEHHPDEAFIIFPTLIVYCEREKAIDYLLANIEVDNTPAESATAPFGLHGATIQLGQI